MNGNKIQQPKMLNKYSGWSKRFQHVKKSCAWRKSVCHYIFDAKKWL